MTVGTIQIIKNRNYFTSVCLGLGKNDVRMSNTIIERMMRILRQQESSWDVVVCCIVVLGFLIFVCWLVCGALLWMDFVQYLVVTRIGGEWVCMYDDPIKMIVTKCRLVPWRTQRRRVWVVVMSNVFVWLFVCLMFSFYGRVVWPTGDCCESFSCGRSTTETWAMPILR